MVVGCGCGAECAGCIVGQGCSTVARQSALLACGGDSIGSVEERDENESGGAEK